MQPLRKKICNLSTNKVLKKITEFLQNCIGPTICIDREIQCLPYAGFSGIL